MKSALAQHWPEYLMEAAGLGLFMVSAGVFGTLLEYPGSPVYQALPLPAVRRAMMGLAMGLTAIVLIYYPWGQQSGAHYNPAVTLTFLRLGKVQPGDALFYVVAQFVGGIAGVLLCCAPRHSALLCASSRHHHPRSAQARPFLGLAAESFHPGLPRGPRP